MVDAGVRVTDRGGVVLPSWVRDSLTYAYWQDEWQKVPVTQRDLFEHLCLLVFQGGLTWSTVLKRREGLRLLFEGFNPVEVAGWPEARVEEVAAEKAGIRNLAKVSACWINARVLVEKGVDLAEVLRRAFPAPLVVGSGEELPTRCPASGAVAEYLSGLGCVRVGPVVCCALAQAAGLIRREDGIEKPAPLLEEGEAGFSHERPRRESNPRPRD